MKPTDIELKDTHGPQPPLRAYGYARDDDDAEVPFDLSEVSVIAGPELLRQIAAFLSHVADLIEKHGDDFGHQHFKDFCRSLPKESADLIVASARQKSTPDDG